ncbi:alpha/beta hydrolase [Paenibacillus sp. JX-17]|uniref:Alpha/beta hydrolase n=1 Tax=Paenibacillus lacisoli TaxID=3064525 RepID=A0ABT9CG65_9BACL|nr:alpha/beta hydrolase [Paenibacillus sp. JX-17]MDO7908279.1 alpha/beta hydrolase [Paenibacillus sp. JX-17]
MLYWITAAVLCFPLLVIASITGIAFRLMVQMKVQTEDRIFRVVEQQGQYRRRQYTELHKKSVSVTSRDGLKLHGVLVEPFPGSGRWMIIVHGYTASHAASAQFADMFIEKGFNILLIDQRRHGKSEGRFTTYGFHEKYDVDAWVHWLLGSRGSAIDIGLHGLSLGGGTVLEYLAIAHPSVRFVIADCPYSDLTELMAYQMTVLNHIPARPFLQLVNARIYRRAGFRLEDVSPIRAVRSSRLPVLFIHGTADTYVPTWMSEAMYEVKPEPKRLFLVEGGLHANAYTAAPVPYRLEVQSFVDQVMTMDRPESASESRQPQESMNRMKNALLPAAASLPDA